MVNPLRWAILMMIVAVPAFRAQAENDGSPVQDKSAFARDVVPFLKAYCTDCHGGDEPEAKLALDRYHQSGNVQEDYGIWEKVIRMLNERQMPPSDMPQPMESEVQTVLAAIRAELDTFDCSLINSPGRVTLRRLNRSEYDNTIRDLLGIDVHPAKDFPSDDVGHGFDNIGDVLSIPPILMEKYLKAAEAVVDLAFADEQARSRILVHQADDDADRITAFRRNMVEFAERAFRRPLTGRDRERLFDLARRAYEAGLRDDEVAKTVCVAVLVSPHFLFRVEHDPDPDDEDGIRELNGWELASRLSYFLWSSMPDRELFELARQGQLQDPKVLRAQVKRMLQDPKARALVENFAGQWLQLRDLATRTPDPELFPQFDEELRSAMQKETEAFFAAVVREDRSILDFLGADYTYVNERLAEHYGLDGVTGEQFRRVELPDQRRGILTQASILLITSNPTRTSPVKRGKWILENILGEPPPPPPPDVPELDEAAEVLGSLRERMEQHRANPSCAVCHRQMDALGFGLENFDAVGAWRDKDGRAKIDPSGELPGGIEFGGPAELMQVLIERKKEAFCRCLTEKLLTYALGRGLESSDRCVVNGIVEDLERQDYRFSALVTGIVLSDPFRKREALGDE